MVWALACLPGLVRVPPIDRDESRFAQASRQMFEALSWEDARLDRRALVPVDRGPGKTPEALGGMHAGGAVVPMVGERARLNKPPLIYWVQSASAWVFTGGRPEADSVWMYRVPSALAALVAALLTWRLGVGMALARPGATGVLAGTVLAACPVVMWESRQARADLVLLACTTLAMLGLWGVWRAASAGSGRRLWGSIGLIVAGTVLGGLTKGPITPMVVVLSAGGLVFWGGAALGRQGRWRWPFRSGVGLAVVACVAALGVWAWGVAEQVGWATYRAVVVDEVLGRSASAKEGHWGPPGYHLVLVTGLFLPGSLCLLAAMVHAWRTRADEAASAFLLAWVVPSWVVFELVSTKLPHYTLPLYPALAVASARLVVGVATGGIERRALGAIRVGAVVWGVVGVAVVLAAPVGLGVVSAMLDDRWTQAHAVAAALALAAAATAAWAAVEGGRGRLVRAAVAGVAASVVGGMAAIGLAVPSTRGVHVSTLLTQHVPPMGPVAAAGYHEDSLVFLTRGRLAKLDPSGVHGWCAAHPDGVVITPVPDPPDMSSAVPPSDWHTVGRVRGLNYAAGRVEDLLVSVGPEHAASRAAAERSDE